MSKVIGLLALAALARTSGAEEVAIAAAKDNTLHEVPGGDVSNGAGEHFFAGRTMQPTQVDQRRGLIEFDIGAAVPAGAVIEEVTLRLYMSMTPGGPFEVSLHRALAEWGEGDSHAPMGEGAGAPAEPGDATWTHTHFPTDLWSAPGGDAAVSPSAGLSVAGVGFYEWSSLQLVADVQAWLDDPGSNHGWMLLGDETQPQTAKRFDSRQNADPARRPILLVRFSLSPTTYCFGVACPCGNDDPSAGCANGSSGLGCALAASGDASLSADTLTLTASGSTPGQPGLFFQGSSAPNGGAGLAFGDGLRCAGGAVVRLQVRQADAGGAASTTLPLALSGGVELGELVRYQWWYRDPAASPCGSGFNLSNGLQLTWGP